MAKPPTKEITFGNEETILEFSESALDPSFIDNNLDSHRFGARNKTIWSMGAASGRDVPFPCYKRSTDGDQIIIRITPARNIP